MELSASHAALDRALGVIPLGTQTMSKHVICPQLRLVQVVLPGV